MVDLDNDERFETAVGTESDSDESYHSLTEELQNITVDQSLNSVNAADSFEFYSEDQCRSGIDGQKATQSKNTRKKFDPDGRKIEDSGQASLERSSPNLFVDSSPDRRKEEAASKMNFSSTTRSASPARDDSTHSHEALDADGAKICDADAYLDEEEECDILSLSSVKAKDDEVELKLKDKELEISVEEMKAVLEAALELKRQGNVEFAASRYGEAIALYNDGLASCPLGAPHDRAALYHNRGVAYAKLGEHKLAVASLTRALEHHPDYTKALARRAAEHEAADDLDAALVDYQSLLQREPSHRDAREAVQRLPPKIAERNEKLKAEMMGKLKDLGNMILKPFGMSTDNFQLQQDPKSGGYNIQFKQNP